MRLGFILLSLLMSFELSGADPLAEFKKRTWDWDKIEAASAELTDVPRENALKILSKRFIDMRKLYLKQYAKTLVALQKRQPPKPKGKLSVKSETAECRRTIAALTSQDKPGKEAIVKEADPALERLYELCLKKPSEVIESDSNLELSRENCLRAAAVFDRLNAPNRKVSDADKRYDLQRSTETDALSRAEWAESVKGSLLGRSPAKVLEKNEKLAAQISAEEANGILELNLRRILCGLNPLEIDVKLCRTARDHSYDMDQEGFFAHESPVPGKKTPSDRAARFGTSANGENIAMGMESYQVANDGWWHSPGHFVNMMRSSFSVIGYGQYKRHWTQNFR